jgi:hypothetical protein
MLIAGILHGIASAVAIVLIPRVTPVRARLLALLPMVPLLYAVTETVRYARQLDELQTRVQLEGLATAAALGGLFLMTWAWLVEAGLPRLPPPAILAVLFVGYACGVWRADRRYG